MQEKTTYKTSGVDIEAGNAFVDRLKLKVPTIGGFGGMYKVPRGYEEPILVSGSDGVGTKICVCSRLRDYTTIGIDSYLDRFFNSYETTTNYPPYNLIHVNNVESILEIALAGFSKNELHVYTEYGKLIVEGKKKEKEKESEYVYQGLAQRSFNRTWSLSEDIEVREVLFKDGLLTVKLGKVVPEHHARKDYL